MRILHLEDAPLDAELIAHELQRGGLECEIRVVANADSFRLSLEEEGWDLILSDYNIPGFDGEKALHVAREERPEVPFIFISGTIGEERAVAALKDGASDYILKDRMARLSAAVRKLMKEEQERSLRRRMGKQIQESQRREELILHSLNMALITAGPTGRDVTWIGEQAERLSGFAQERFLREPGFWASRLHPEDRDRVLKALAAAAPGRNVTVEYRWQVAEGSYRWFQQQGALVPSEGGRPEMFATWLDINERKNLEASFFQAQKMEAVGQLAGGVAHDFNNLITVITGYSAFLLKTLKPGDPAREDVEEIKRAGERAAGLTRQLLTFSRRQVIQPKVLDVNSVIADMQKMLVRLIGENVDLVSHPAPAPALVRCDPGQLEQVIMNLAVNARDAMPQGGKITVETQEVDLDGNYAASHAEVVPGRYVLLAVSDTGTGMDSATQARIFEPFFTTKGAGKGTGLGLATVYGIVKQSGGHVAVYSEPGHGTTFKVYLPREQAESVSADTQAAVTRSLQGTETVLVVEDEEAVRQLACRTLREHGYRVIEARRGDEALRLVEETKTEFALVITDVVMPEMGGRELVVRLAVGHPLLKTLFMSGYTGDAVVRHGVLVAGTPFVQKPFTPQTLLEKVREVLDAPAGGG